MKKYLGLILCCSLLLTACGNDKNTSKQDNSLLSTAEITETATKESATIAVGESINSLSENTCSEMLGLQWGDNVDTVKQTMTDYISSYEESHENDTTGEIETFLAYIDIEFMGELCDINFQFVDGKLTQISYSYIWNESKTKSDSEWIDAISQKYGEGDKENKCYPNENTVVSMLAHKTGIYVDYTPNSKASSNQSNKEVQNEGIFIPFYSPIDAIKQQMNDYELISEENSESYTTKEPQTLLTYKYILQNDMECKLGLCFQNAGLIGINFMFPATLQDGIGLYENIYDNIANEYGKVTDDTRTSVMYTAFWDNNPNGEGTSIYLFKNEDSTVQLSYFASEEYSENVSALSSIDITKIPISDYSFFTNEYIDLEKEEFLDIDVSEIKSDDLNAMNELIHSTPVTSGYSSSFGTVILKLFLDFDITYQVSNLNDSVYIVKYTGNYMPNPDVPEYVERGSISFKIDIDANTCTTGSSGAVYQAMVACAVLQ